MSLKQISQFIIFILCIISVSTCTKNENTVTDLNTDIGLEISGEHESFGYIPCFIIDKNDNLFLLDNSSSSIKKFNKYGTFVKSFCGNGTGPGEINSSYEIALLKDTIYVEDTNLQRMALFNLNGKFLKFMPLRNSEYPLFIKSFGNNKFVGYCEKIENTSKGKFRSYILKLYNSKFETLKVLRTFREKYDSKSNSNYLDQFAPFCVSKNKIYVSSNYDSKYEIFVYDQDGNKISKINRRYSKKNFNNKEIENFKKFIKKNMKAKMNKKVYKKAINYLYFDAKTNYLWVEKSLDRKDNSKYNPIFDIFYKGKYEKTVRLKNIFFENDFFDFDDQITHIKNNVLYRLQAKDSKILTYRIKDN